MCIRDRLEAVCYDHFAEIRRKIDIHREEMKAKLDDIALKMIERTVVHEGKYMQKIRENAAKKVQVDIVHEEKNLLEEFRKPSLDLNDVKRMHVEQETNIQNMQKIMCVFRNLQAEMQAFQFKENTGLTSESFGALVKPSYSSLKKEPKVELCPIML